MLKSFLQEYKYPAPGEEHPLLAQYWAELLDYAGKVDFHYTDLSQSNTTENIKIPCGGTYNTWWGGRCHPFVTISPLSATQASLPRAEASRALILDTLSGVWSKSLLEDSNIVISSTSASSTCDVVEYVQVQGNKQMDLGTTLAQVATAVWVEGVLLTRNTDYCVRKCIVQCRPNFKPVSSPGSPSPIPRLISDPGARSIANPYNILPRRLWDLVNNRVIDMDAFASANGTPRVPVGGYWAITHSWTSDMKRWLTPINNYRWPVPLPEGITFEQIRWEALRAGAVYCWLDVLCLRQRTMEFNPSRGLFTGVPHLPVEIGIQKRLEEWSIDVPTIGNNYRQATNVLRYFNGLGRPLQLSGWGDPRHWLNRAWTLQETRPEHIMVNGGLPEGMRLPLQALVSMGGHEDIIGGTRQHMRQLLAPLSRLVKNAEPDYLSEESMLDMLWPIILNSRRSSWVLWQCSSAFRSLLAVAMLYKYSLSPIQYIPLTRLWQDNNENPCRVAHTQRPREQVWADFLKNVGIDVEAGIYGSMWEACVLTLSIWYLSAIILVGWDHLQQQQLWYGIGVWSEIARRLRTRWQVISPAGDYWDSVVLSVILYCWVRGVLLVPSQEFLCLSALEQDIRTVVLLEQYLTIPWFHQFVWPRVVAVSSALWWVLSQRYTRVWIAPVAISYIMTINVDGRIARWRTAWRRARVPIMNDRQAECSSILDLACEISRRYASNEIDKIAGLSYLMKCRMLPLYSETEDIEDGWVQLVQHLHIAAQLELLFNFPAARDDDVVVSESSNGDNVNIHAHTAYRARSWIPTWNAVSSLQRGRDMELQRPTWPPRWLKDDVHASDLRTFYADCAGFDCGTGALVVPVCPRVLMTTGIAWDDGSGSYSVHVAGGSDTTGFVHSFYSPYGYPVLPLREEYVHLLISHARDNQAGPLSWVVAQLISPDSSYVRKACASKGGFGALCKESIGAWRKDVTKYVRDLSLPHEILAHMLLVKKVGILVTDDMRPFTFPDIECHKWCAVNVPVVFV